MFIAMNRFKVKPEFESDFEAAWKNRDSHLKELPGFLEFKMLRGPLHENEGYRLYATHTTWNSYDDFIGWTKSEQFRESHRNAGSRKEFYAGPPNFEGFDVISGI